MTNFLDVLNRNMLNDRNWKPHPERRTGGTNYISTFLNGRGDAVALDLGSGSENAIWTLARLMPGTLLPEIRRAPYVAAKGRNSNLNVHQLKGKPLVRLFPESLAQARLLIEQLANP